VSDDRTVDEDSVLNLARKVKAGTVELDEALIALDLAAFEEEPQF